MKLSGEMPPLLMKPTPNGLHLTVLKRLLSLIKIIIML